MTGWLTEHLPLEQQTGSSGEGQANIPVGSVVSDPHCATQQYIARYDGATYYITRYTWSSDFSQLTVDEAQGDWDDRKTLTYS